MRPAIRPGSLAEARAALLDTTGPVAIAGAGTAADWAGRLGEVDTVLSTEAMRGVITHNPGDMTVSVHAGTPLRELQEELAPYGQHVAFDAPRIADGATVGGLVATADAGPAALVHGSLRELVIGTTTLLADGSVVRSGGHVIKNVAGFDVSKLVHGSYGTLGMLCEVVLRLHPVPTAVGTLVVGCTLAEAARAAGEVLSSQLEPTALEWLSSGKLLVRIDSTRAALPARLERMRALIGGSPEEPGDGSGRSGSGAWAEHAELTRGTPGAAVLRIGAKPGLLPELLERLPAGPGPVGFGAVGFGAVEFGAVGLGTGIATVSLPGAAVAEAHATVHAAGGTSVLRTRPADLDVPAWGPPPSAAAVLRAVKRRLDPDSRLGPGRFDPWEI